MIPKGNAHDNARRLGKYMFQTDPGERAYIQEVRGFGMHEMAGASRVMTPEEVIAALTTVEIIAAGTKAKQPFYHFYVRIGEQERLDDPKWLETAERMKLVTGLKDQPHVIAFHENEITGEKHMHVAVSRIDAERMRAINMHKPVEKMMQEARILEKEFGLRQLSSTRDINEPKAPKRNELEEARRLDLDERALRRDIRRAFDHSDSGKGFSSALDAQEMVLTNGTRRDCMVVIDREGGHHALNKKLLGIGAAQIRERLGDVDRSQLEDADTVSRRIKQERREERERAQRNATVAAAYYSREEETSKRELAMLEAADRAAPELARRMDTEREHVAAAQRLAGQAQARHARETGNEATLAARAAPLAAKPLRGLGEKADSIARAGAPITRGAERLFGGVVEGLTDLVSNAGRYERQEQEARQMSEDRKERTPNQRAAEQDRRNPLTNATPDVENKLRYHQNPNDVALQQLRWHIENARREREAAAERDRGQERERDRGR
jgi:hypothetical protein